VIPNPPFQLGVTLASGQFFRWRAEGDGFLVSTHGRTFAVRERRDRLAVSGIRRSFAERFFALDHDLPGIRGRLLRDRRLRPAVEAYPGLRILRQDPWECLVSFVTSCASNIPRITRNLESLCRELGRKGLAMPPPEAISDERVLRRLGFGFRARHLVPLAREVERGALRGLERLATEEARERLCALPGVGVKVADCVLLFAYERLESFPVDVWIRRAMAGLFGGRRDPRTVALERWGELSGYAQQFLYVWSRKR